MLKYKKNEALGFFMGTFIKQNDLDLFSTSEQAILVTDNVDDNVKKYLEKSNYCSENNNNNYKKMVFIYQYLRSYFYDNENKDLIYDVFLNVYLKISGTNFFDKDKPNFISPENLKKNLGFHSTIYFDTVTSFLYDVDFIRFENSCLIPLLCEKQELSKEQIEQMAEKYFDDSVCVIVFESKNYLEK